MISFIQPSRRFAAGTFIRVGMRAKEYGIDAPACVIDRFVHFVINGVVSRHVEQPASNARLIGGDDHAIPGMRQAGNRLQAARVSESIPPAF
jgi:hypothetical protein